MSPMNTITTLPSPAVSSASPSVMPPSPYAIERAILSGGGEIPAELEFSRPCALAYTRLQNAKTCVALAGSHFEVSANDALASAIEKTLRNARVNFAHHKLSTAEQDYSYARAELLDHVYRSELARLSRCQ